MLHDHPCASSSQLAALVEGGLSDTERDIVLSHIRECPKCFFVYRNALAQMAAAPAATLPRGVSWYWQMFLKWGRIVAAIVVFALVLEMFINEVPAWHTPAYWQQAKLVDPADPLHSRVNAVFARVRAVVPEAQAASLLLVEDPETLALAIPGAVVLSRSAAELCLNHSDPAMGEARLALVLGHELAHLSHREYFHGFVAFKRGPDPLDRLRSVEKRTAAEAAADQWGLLIAAQAGFDPAKMLIDKHAFFTQWEARKGGYWDGYPDVAARVATLGQRVEIAAEAYRYFEVGVRFYQMGRYDEARGLLQTYLQAFPGREVHNNLGLVALQKGGELLAACDGASVSRFKLPLILDSETLAKATRLRGGNEGSPCLENPAAQALFKEAVAHFQRALALDPGYTPALLNLASTHLLTQHPAEALAAASTLGNSPDSGVVKALALYLFAVEKGLAAEKEEALASLATLAPGNAYAAYNLAAIQTEQGSDASGTWQVFLNLESAGPYAAFAREALGLPEDLQAIANPLPPSKMLLGPIGGETATHLQSMTRHLLHAEDVAEVTLYESPAQTAIAQDNELLMILDRLTPPTPLSQYPDEVRQASRLLTTLGFVLQGEGWMLEVEGEHVTQHVVFQRK